MAATFEQQFAVYERSLDSTYGKKAISLVHQTNLLLTEWKNEGILILTLHPHECGCGQTDPHHWPVTRDQIRQIHKFEEERWRFANEDKKRTVFSSSTEKNAKKRYHVSNLFYNNLLLTSPEKKSEAQMACEASVSLSALCPPPPTHACEGFVVTNPVEVTNNNEVDIGSDSVSTTHVKVGLTIPELFKHILEQQEILQRASSMVQEVCQNLLRLAPAGNIIGGLIIPITSPQQADILEESSSGVHIPRHKSVLSSQSSLHELPTMLSHGDAEHKLSFEENTKVPSGQFPVNFDHHIGRQVYGPWSLLDLEAYVCKLPSLSSGANVWITELNRLTAHEEVAVRDLRAILGRIKGTMWLTRFENNAGTIQIADTSLLAQVCTRFWDALRLEFPMKTDVALMRTLKMKPDENIHDYITRAQSHYFHTMSSHYDRDDTHVQIFRDMVLTGLPDKLCDTLVDVAGLSVKPQAEWQAVVLHHYNRYIKENNTKSESTTKITHKIALLQLQELERQKKKLHTTAQDAAFAKCMLTVSTTTPAPQEVIGDWPMIDPPSSMCYQNTYPMQNSVFRGPTQRGLRRRGKRQHQGLNTQQYARLLQNAECWHCHGFGHLHHSCPLGWSPVGPVNGGPEEEDFSGNSVQDSQIDM